MITIIIFTTCFALCAIAWYLIRPLEQWNTQRAIIEYVSLPDNVTHRIKEVHRKGRGEMGEITKIVIQIDPIKITKTNWKKGDRAFIPFITDKNYKSGLLIASIDTKANVAFDNEGTPYDIKKLSEWSSCKN